MKKKYRKFTHWNGEVTVKRIVNQEEIIDYLKTSPYATEAEICWDIYKYDRSTSMSSNKKYADCLRRALHKGRIHRIPKLKGRSKFLYYVPKTSGQQDVLEMKDINKNNFDSFVVEAKRRGLVPGAKFKLIQGNVGDINVVDISDKFYMSNDRLMVYSDDMRGCYTLFKDGVWVELVKPVEPKEMTLEQVCDALGYEVKIICKK
jgi:hypothetical protein